MADYPPECHSVATYTTIQIMDSRYPCALLTVMQRFLLLDKTVANQVRSMKHRHHSVEKNPDKNDFPITGLDGFR